MMVVAGAILIEMVSTNGAAITVLIAFSPLFTAFTLSGLLIGVATVRGELTREKLLNSRVCESNHLFSP